LKSEKVMRYIDLFGGIGGFRLGIERAKPDWKCVWYCDIDKYAVQIYNSRFGEKYEARDIREVDEKEIPEHDLLCGGFPCQSFSIAGKRKGFEDRRGNLFFEICRIARAKRPKILFLENVKGLLSHERGKTFAVIINSLQELGYWIEWQVLNSKNFGVPQNRERVFIIGHLGKEGGQQVFPLGRWNKVSNEKNERASCGNKVASAITADYHKLPANRGETYIEEPHMIHNIYGGFKEKKVRVFKGISPTIRTPKGGGHLPLVMNTLTEAIGTRQGSSSEFIRSVEKIIKATGRIRRLTPIECERLQGFPDGWTEGVSDTQRYKLLGNAVTVNVIEAIAKSECDV
jgi:DNA (cytosine-5)-methyltransferase 1